ncbi:LodA/GoxA family CTQ-dependent oxidase [Azospirillum sp.]|uniref:LodA/GoxA family CTQ-dependent oxidase n=1 Tax=Azospirillum sp. TaxID=34012 RepID=UPI003D7469A2
MTSSVFRIHPAIGFARVGDSEEYYLAPETMAGMPVPGRPGLTGGLPVKPGTEDEPITASDLRDADGRLKRQAARFRIFAYPAEGAAAYPAGGGSEVKLGDRIGDKTVVDILWTVHVANKKGNAYVLDVPGYDGSIIERYADGRTPPLRNVPSEVNQTSLTVQVPNINDPERVRAWTTDPGPRAVGKDRRKAAFDAATEARAGLTPLPGYPKLFPAGDPNTVYAPRGPIDTLGHIETDEQGRLIVLGGYGRACSVNGYQVLGSDVDNDGWFDDTSDGPVTATLVLRGADGVLEHADAGQAWVVTADPAYAPQILNTVSLWDELYDTFVRSFDLQPELYTRKDGYRRDYAPSFPDHVEPVFKAASLQEWTTNLPGMARQAHKVVGEISAKDDPARTIMAGLAFVRDPNLPTQSNLGAPLMPLGLGDSGKAFLSPTYTQYFFLEQWDTGRFEAEPSRPLGSGERLDRAALSACLGGRFSPGIDLTFTVRQPDVYQADWWEVGPFRIAARPLNYSRAVPDQPFLTGGYVPLNSGHDTVEPGDMTKFMSVPWHTDYNSCATHPTSPSIRNITTLYWSWPAQRPVHVRVAAEVQPDGALGPYRYSVRGTGTGDPDPANQGRYQDRGQIIPNWSNIGVVLQGSAIDTVPGRTMPPDAFLEAESRLDGLPDPAVEVWPMNELEPTA